MTTEGESETMTTEGESVEREQTEGVPAHTARRRSALLWGAVATLLFPALLLAYRVGTGETPVGPLPAMLLALVIGGVVAATAYKTEHRLARKGRT